MMVTSTMQKSTNRGPNVFSKALRTREQISFLPRGPAMSGAHLQPLFSGVLVLWTFDISVIIIVIVKRPSGIPGYE